MTATATAPHAQQPAAAPPAQPRWWTRPSLLPPIAFTVANAVAFYILRPPVNDLWAARARASAVQHGVGLDYWFSWFGGGSTPGNYSIVTPYLCAAIGTELTLALATVVASVLICFVVRDTPHETTAAWFGAFGVVCSCWSGRVPFALGTAAALGALLAVRHGKRWMTVVLTLLACSASPLAGAFLVLGLSGTFLTTRTKAYRPIIGYAAVTAGVALLLTSFAFGSPGPEPFTNGLLLELAIAFIVLLAGPPDHLRTTFWVTVLATLAAWWFPNGVGSNIARFVWFALPVAVMALSNKRTIVAATFVAPLLLIGGFTTLTDVRHASDPVASVTYYRSLIARLDTMPDLGNCRLELVDHGGRAGYDALLDHAMLARGWETQEDTALNSELYKAPLDPVTYKLWLDNNAVCYVALPSFTAGPYPEYKLVSSGKATYLTRVWWDPKWDLFRVENPTPIVGPPGAALSHDQKSMTIRVPCRCTIPIRVHWSKYLSAVLQQRAPSGPGRVDAVPAEHATVTDDGSGWTVLTTQQPGVYVLRGSLGAGLFK
jgi:hypothetical protein